MPEAVISLTVVLLMSRLWLLPFSIGQEEYCRKTHCCRMLPYVKDCGTFLSLPVRHGEGFLAPTRYVDTIVVDSWALTSCFRSLLPAVL